MPPKQKEGTEKSLNLPPGLVNHGNTCFMNSVLQGLLATHYLKNLIQFTPLPPFIRSSALTQISSHRSPLLTNGHGLGGEKWEKDWEKGMPIGDVFLSFVGKAWAIQQEKRRESMSPKEILTALGQKYDQYLDFRQQDAHEFLRQLLDAMRMEELDMIKVRQPKPKKHIRRRSTMRTGSSFLPQNPSPLAAVMNHSLTSPAAPDDDEKLVPFVDMLFGGRLTSILVCQECKHISHTYEDFNDLSLSIKPEDYAKERKRDKLKNLAKKFRLSTGSGSEGIRASSVPASPRKTVDEGSLDEVPAEEPRRRSADYEDAAEPEPRSGDVEAVATTTETSVGIAEEGGESIADSELELLEERDHVEFVQPLKIEKKPKDDDGWAKLGRKISMSVRFPPKDKDGRRRSRSRGRPPDIIAKGRNSEDSAASLSATSLNSTPMSSPKPPNASVASPTPLSPTPLREPAGLKADAPRAVSLSPALLANAPTSPDIVPISPPLPALSRFPPISRVVSPSIASGSKQPPSPRPPKATAEEAAYLRQILADIIPASNPFGIFKPSGTAGAAISSTATNLLMKMGQLPGIEECLRMFTAVEVLDKENMVGCRRCWKITNGVYRPRVQQSGEDSDDSDENEKSEEKPSVNAFTTPAPAVVEEIGVDVEGPSPPSSPSASASSSIASGDGLSDSTYDTPQSSLSNEVSLPRKQTEQLNITSPLTTLEPNSPTYGGMPIPIISTTAPESSLPVLSTRKSPSPLRKPFFKDHSGLAEVLAAPLPIRDSLRAPRVTKHKRIPGYIDSADESSDDGADSDASGGTSIFSDTSSLASRVHSSNVSLEQLPPPAVTIPTSPAALSVPAKVSRPKQVIMRAAYKRYLIATPPPVLVINLKRFQQVLKSPMISFSSGFKKLDDFVAFPELLDLAPFLAPKKEDFGLGKSGKVKFKSKNAGTCIYRLYAVVVHIGNMLGGHYVAYTALPTAAPEGVPDTTPEITSRPKVSNFGHSDLHIPRKWAYISDTVVRLATLDEVLKAKAYICMYERV